MDGASSVVSESTARPPLRIAVVTETYLPEINGVAMTMGQIVKGLLNRGHYIELIRPRQYPNEVPADRGRFEELLLRGIPIPRYDALKLGVASVQQLVRRWRVKRPDIVHLVTEGPLGWSALRAAMQLGLPIASDFHTNFHTYTPHYGIGWLKKPITAYLRRFHNSTLCTIVPTSDLRDDLDALGFKNLVIVARGVDTQLFSPARRDPLLRQMWRAEPDDPVAVCVGRMAPEKNLELLLETYEAMRAVHPRAKLVVVGDGPERGRLMPRYPHVIFSGARIGTDLAAHYASADMFLYPSLTETYGNVTVEALSSGIAVVAFRYAAAAQHIHDGENGITVPFADRDGFIRASLDLMCDRERLVRLGRAARATMSALDWADIVSQFESTLVGLAKEQSGGAHARLLA
ncbi:MAG: glycosyltransferase family 4 protein [Burkholderiales bacterium]